MISTTLISGKLLKVDVVGNYCYCAANGSLKILSLENPQNPTLIGEIPTGGQARFIEVIDNYAYVLYPSGLMVIDVTNPENPQMITDFTEVAGAMEMVRNGDIAVVSNLTDELTILDIGNPRDPTIIGSIDSIAYSVWHMHLEGHILYTNGYNNTTIISIANPASPTIVGYIGSSSPGIIKGYNGYLYLNYGDAGIKIYSIFNPVTPYYAGEIPHNYNMITFHGNYAYLKSAHGYSGRYIFIVDISNPADPVVAGSYTTSYEPENQLHAENGYLFTLDDTSSWENTIYISDLSSPADPVEISSYASHGGYISDVYVFDNYAYVIGPQLFIVDITDENNPAVVGRTDARFSGGRIDNFDSYIYIVGEYIDGMPIYNISNPNSPQLVATFNTPVESNFRDLQVVDNLIYVAGGDQGLLVLDISNPASPELIEQVEISASEVFVSSVCVSGNYCYATFCGTGLKIFNISDPRNLTMVNDDVLPICSKQLFVVDNVAILPVEFHGIEYVDVSDPVSPAPIGGGYLGPWSFTMPKITVAGNSMIVPYYEVKGVDIVNISDPRNAYLDRTFDTPNCATGISAVNGIIYVADGSSLCLFRYPY
ncbi:MAG: hypothetical protein JSW64_09495 [Candidatus Zixiibacteriota bacterium]|nr:MAG: hypothetical protein JSW64_09495 [candidate division Zixibacteria bacterium]